MKTVRPVRTWRTAALLALGVSVGGSAPAVAQPTDAGVTVPWMRDRTDPRWVYGMVVVPIPAATVQARLRNVDTWPRLFSDIRSLRVVRRGGDEWTVRLQTVVFECGPHDYHVRFASDGTVHLQIDAPGVDAVARVEVRDGQTPGRAAITYRLFVDAHGVVGWFVSEASLRRRQEAMVVRYLTDLRRGFSQ